MGRFALVVTCVSILPELTQCKPARKAFIAPRWRFPNELIGFIELKV